MSRQCFWLFPRDCVLLCKRHVVVIFVVFIENDERQEIDTWDWETKQWTSQPQKESWFRHQKSNRASTLKTSSSFSWWLSKQGPNFGLKKKISGVLLKLSKTKQHLLGPSLSIEVVVPSIWRQLNCGYIFHEHLCLSCSWVCSLLVNQIEYLISMRHLELVLIFKWDDAFWLEGNSCCKKRQRAAVVLDNDFDRHLTWCSRCIW